MKPSEITAVLPKLLKSRRPVFLWGKSGIGKSAIIHQFCKANNLQLNDARLSQLESIDMKGFPVPDMKAKKMEWLPADFLPRQSDPPGLLFLDECNGALPATASAAYQLILDFRLGSYVFPEHWGIVAAGNNQSDRGVTHQMPAPLNNRFVHIDYDLNAEDWHKQAMVDNIHLNIRAYLRLKPGSLHVFDSAVNPRSFPTPRTWYFANELYESDYSPTQLFELLKGTVGEGAAAEFIGFCRDIAAMPDIDSILLDPEKAKLPGTQPVMHAVVTALGDKTTMSSFDRIMIYNERLPREVQAVYVRNALNKESRVANTKPYMDWALKNQDILL
jgi:hypothetical protein